MYFSYYLSSAEAVRDNTEFETLGKKSNSNVSMISNASALLTKFFQVEIVISKNSLISTNSCRKTSYIERKAFKSFPSLEPVAKETERIFADNIFFMNFFSKYPKKRKESLIDRHLYVSLHNSKRKHSEFSSKHSPKPLIESLKLK